MARRALLLLAASLWLAPRPAAAHGFSPGVLTLSEQEPGLFALTWSAPVDTSRDLAGVDLAFPDHCRRGPDRLDCSPAGLRGTLAVRGLEGQRVRVIVFLTFLDGQSREAILTGDAPSLHIDRPAGRSALAWLLLGVEHILTGLDHLAFLAGLLLVVGLSRGRRLLATITAFTLAHSLTLALAATGVVRLASAPVEATIAASVILVAREATHDRPTVTREAPWAVALLFGLVHGLGFAGVLTAGGLPAGWIGWSLLWFNLGVELGQIAVLGVVLAFARLAGERLSRHAWPRAIACYAVGALGAYWLIERTAGMFTGAP